MPDDLLLDVKGVVFDLDETLIDAEKGMNAAHEATVAKLCEYLPCEEKDLSKKKIMEKLLDFDDRMNLEKRYDRDEWWAEFARDLSFGEELDQSQVKELTRVYWQTYSESAVPYPPTNSVLEYLDERGYRLGILTDTDGPKISKKDRIVTLDFIDFFGAIVVGGDDTPKTKPDSEPFELVASKLGLGTRECVMVGDKPFTDIRGANLAGMGSILIKRREWNVEEDPDFTIESLEDLEDLL